MSVCDIETEKKGSVWKENSRKAPKASGKEGGSLSLSHTPISLTGYLRLRVQEQSLLNELDPDDDVDVHKEVFLKTCQQPIGGGDRENTEKK